MIARVIIDQSANQIDRLFDYEIPQNLNVQKGDRVIVPFGTREVNGFVVDIAEKSDYETKPIKSLIGDYKCISEEMLQLMHYMRKRFFLKYVDILRLFLPSDLRTGKVDDLERYFVSLNPSFSFDEIMSKVSARAEKQIQIIETLKTGGKYLSELDFLFGSGAVNALVKKGLVIKELKKIDRVPMKDIKVNKKEVDLSPDQKNALNTIFNTKKDVVLLHGVTGSGKTVVYMNAIQRVLDEGKTAIMLVPEISLTPQMLMNFRGEFGDKVAVLHSALSSGEKFDEWKKLLQGDAKIVVGARSAIFAPVQNVGLIIVDEEHDSSYVSESNPRYRVLEVARFRANYNKTKVVLGSATPSIESYKKAVDGEYELARMPKRISECGLPEIKIVDMKQEVLHGNNTMFSVDLRNRLQETVSKGEQAMLLINRLGYSSLLRCRKCGYVPKCKHCDVTLTYHKTDGKLKCHYCGAVYTMLSECPECHSQALGFGKMGTETVVEGVKKLIPDVNVLKLDSETKSKKNGMANVLRDFADNKAQVLVGTQMIAKGHDFANVTLVGLIDADLGLYQQDYRSNERTFQLVTQMSGRAGRADKKGYVVLQTYSPSNYVYKFAIEHNYEKFYRKEINIREVTHFPPFVSIIRIIATHEKNEKVREVAREIYKLVREEHEKNSHIYSLAGMEAPISMIQDKYRYQIVVRISKEDELDTLTKLYDIVRQVKIGDVSVFVEQDPQSMM